ncbi:GAF domain-containing protein [Baekduia soli]|uniref:GAF domain-containing protein n=1 Tax=Baekduia soli TaxID=496014 RepID=UPI0016526DEE|nr:GAF domain-containing protein [Baekduia soli]
MEPVAGGPDIAGLRAAALQAIVDALREQYGVGRCTLRLDVEDDVYPVAFEARADGVGTLIGDTTVVLKGQPVVEAMLAGAGQVVQHDSARASGDPAFQRMLVAYGGMAAQIVTAVRADGRLLGLLSLHELGAPRMWTEAETRGAVEACGLIAQVLA